MNRNPVIPFATIALMGLLLVIIIGFVGADQRDNIAEEGEEAQTEEGADEEDSQEGQTTDDPSAVYETNCASCHGADLSGGAGPELVEVGNRMSEDEIFDIIMNGQGAMPGGLVSEEEADAITTWLLEEQ
jgi:mono/diheme cytochrome c family protein